MELIALNEMDRRISLYDKVISYGIREKRIASSTVLVYVIFLYIDEEGTELQFRHLKTFLGDNHDQFMREIDIKGMTPGSHYNSENKKVLNFETRESAHTFKEQLNHQLRNMNVIDPIHIAENSGIAGAIWLVKEAMLDM